MNILIVASHYAVCSARYAADAFTRRGHTVRHIGPEMGRTIWGLTLPERYVWTPDDIGIPSALKADWANLVIVMDSDPAVLDWVKEWHHSAIIVWGVDNHVRDYRRAWFEHYFLAHRNVSVMEWLSPTASLTQYFQVHPEKRPALFPTEVQEYTDMTHLPCAYDPTLHTPSPIPFEDREYDVCMIGVMYPHRWAIVQALRAAGFKVLAGTGLVYDSYVRAYQNSRISLCLSSNGDVAQRVFETAAMGCVVMSDDCPDFQLLKPKGFWLLDDTEPETVVQAVKDVLHEPEHAQVMIERAQAWVQPHTWDNRAAEIEAWYERR